MTDIGAKLRLARERRGLSQRDIAQRTKLSIGVLDAMERNDFASLPGGMFRKAYLRTVAAEVGIDADEIGADYSAQFEVPVATPAEAAEASRHARLIEQLAPAPRRSIVALSIMAAAAVVWFSAQREPPAVPVASAGGPFVAVQAADGAAAVIDGGVVRRTPAVTAPLSVVIDATRECWISAAADGERVLHRIVAPGERVLLHGRQRISLRLGDAGAVRLSINEGVSRLFGGRGEVVAIEVTPDTVDDLRGAAGPAASGG